MAKDINKHPFSESTKLKLDILSDFFDDWFPVFLMTQSVDDLYIFDFFAGSGKDSNGEYGSPLILINEAKKFCEKIYRKANNKSISFIFNEKLKNKFDELEGNIDEFVTNCRNNHCNKEYFDERCFFNIKKINNDFEKIFFTSRMDNILNDNKKAKFLFLDQYGIKHINEKVFKTLINSPKTDFIFFISSSIVTRFSDIPEIKQYIDINNIKIVEDDYDKSHLIVLEYYKNLIPKDMEYYIHGFSIKRGANYYGLIFGSSHSLGMEKFLDVCWKYDKFSGESNHNINKDSTFFGIRSKNKENKIAQNIWKLVLNGDIKTNKEGFKYTMQNGCKPYLFSEVIKNMEKDKKIKLIPINSSKIDRSHTNIHKVNEYKIEVL